MTPTIGVAISEQIVDTYYPVGMKMGIDWVIITHPNVRKVKHIPKNSGGWC